MDTVTDLKKLLMEERQAAFFRLRGGYPIPLAGGIWWALLGGMGFVVHNRGLWIFLAFALSGVLFPLALLLSKLFHVDFMKDRTPVSDVVFPAMGSMLLFWPMAIAAYWSFPQLVPLILGVGMSIMWPVIGWSYGRTALYSTHAIVRAVVCFVIWNWWPAARFTVLPLAVSLIYVVSVVAMIVLSSPRARAASLPIRELA
ncbi:MAG TPA: hypothetical protein VGN16_08980 [Acidobacteriaceae bacterium]